MRWTSQQEVTHPQVGLAQPGLQEGVCAQLVLSSRLSRQSVAWLAIHQSHREGRCIPLCSRRCGLVRACEGTCLTLAGCDSVLVRSESCSQPGPQRINGAIEERRDTGITLSGQQRACRTLTCTKDEHLLCHTHPASCGSRLCSS